jgi:hypothetical protein
MAIAVLPGEPDPDRFLTRLALVAFGIVIGLFAYAMLDAYLL